MARINIGAIGLAPGDSCYDPNHPWWLANMLNTKAECECIDAQGRPVDERCVYAMSTNPWGNPIDTSYTRSEDTPSVTEIATEIPGDVIAWTANQAGRGAASGLKGVVGNLDLFGLVLLAGAGFVAYKYLTR